MDEKVDVPRDELRQDVAAAQSSPTPPSTYIPPRARKLHDPDVTFEEYHYYANKTRVEQDTLDSPGVKWLQLLSGKQKQTTSEQELHLAKVNLANYEQRLTITDEEWTNASRAFRTASWGACFYLVWCFFFSSLPVP